MNLTQATDQAIARENARVTATLCRPCIGTGRLYRPNSDGTHTPTTCQRCSGTGERVR